MAVPGWCVVEQGSASRLYWMNRYYGCYVNRLFGRAQGCIKELWS